MNKLCTQCNIEVDKFYGHRYGTSVCKQCYKKLHSSEFRTLNKDKIALKKKEWASTEVAKKLNSERSKRYQAKEKGKITTSKALKKYRETDRGRYTTARHDVLNKKKSFLLDEETYLNLIKQNCYYCNGKISKSGVGLDRIDNSKGYELGNVLPCCGDCNRTRGDRFSVEETKAIMLFIEEYRSKNE
jgi:hypothetical protein